jgi:replicative DNA helicase
MTQAIYRFPQEMPRFDTVVDVLPPCNIEAEEAILGGILLDPDAIHRVKDRLQPEHFYISSHKDIYQACLTLSKKGDSTDLITVTNWLSDHDLLKRIGGRNKLASLIDRTVSAINIDKLAVLVIDKAIMRDIIRIGNEIVQLGYSTDVDLPELIHALAKKTKSIIDTPSCQTQEENERAKHDRLLQELTSIYTTCSEPTLKLWRLKNLADNYKVSINFLDMMYLKSLTAQCSKLLSYEELKELAGSTIREWLLNGLVPKHSTICLVSDGGIGKTKYIYGICKILIQGTQFGPFIATGKKRRILYYQGDESEGDMLQALETLGYSEDDINKYVRVRFGWSAENMPMLIQDLKGFQPDMVVIDSLSTANRFSVYRESEMEYARPILEMTGLANQFKTTFVIIHHTNKEGGVRGTTAIRNAVSEVWRLKKDTSQFATPNDRILEIDKSRSRSSNKKYRLMFNPEDLTFTFLGEESDQLADPASQTAKEKTLEFFAANRNTPFTNQEIAHRLNVSQNYARRYLGEMAADGLVSVKRRPGKANTYFLTYETDPGLIHRYDSITLELHPDHPPVHPSNQGRTSDSAKGDPQDPKNGLLQVSQNPEILEILEAPTGTDQDHTSPNCLPDKHCRGDLGGDTQNYIEVQPRGESPSQPAQTNNIEVQPRGESPSQPAQTNNIEVQPRGGSTSQPSQTNNIEVQPRGGSPSQVAQSEPSTNQPFTVTVEGKLGITTAKVSLIKAHKKYLRVQIDYTFADGSTATHEAHPANRREAETIARKEITRWHNEAILKQNYRIRQMGEDSYIWVDHCKMITLPNPPANSWYVFEAPGGQRLQVAGDDEFEVQVQSPISE